MFLQKSANECYHFYGGETHFSQVYDAETWKQDTPFMHTHSLFFLLLSHNPWMNVFFCPSTKSTSCIFSFGLRENVPFCGPFLSSYSCKANILTMFSCLKENQKYIGTGMTVQKKFAFLITWSRVQSHCRVPWVIVFHYSLGPTKILWEGLVDRNLKNLKVASWLKC